MRKKFNFPIHALLVCTALVLFAGIASAQTTAFTYQGSLKDGAGPANGAYQMQFKLFDAVGGGTQIGPTLNDVSITADQGVFSVKLDFGASALSGANRFLEIAVRRNSTDPYITLAPREQIASAPYSVRTLSAASADSLSTACVGCVQDGNINSVSGVKVTGAVASAINATNSASATNASQLGGVAASQYVQTNDSRLSDARNPLPGSASYIQNSTTPQTSTNFNIGGNGTVGSLTANGPFSVGGISAPSVAPAGQGRFYFDSVTNKFRISQNGGAFVDLVGSSGISGNGTVSRIPLWSAGTTLGDSAITQIGNKIGVGPLAPLHNLSISNGPPWTTASWAGNIDLSNASAIGWRPNLSSQSFGIGQSNGGFYFFRSLSPPGSPSQPPIYDMFISDTGNVGIGTITPSANLDVAGTVRAVSASASSITVETTGNNSGALLAMTAPGRSWIIGTSASSGNAFQLLDGIFDVRMTVQPNGGPISFPTGNVGIGGNATQSRDKGGWVKAMLLINNGTIVRCFNSQATGSAVFTVPCNFSVVPGGLGDYIINFGFQVNDRFVQTTPFTLGGPAQFVPAWHNPASHTPNQLAVFPKDQSGNGAGNAQYFVFVF